MVARYHQRIGVLHIAETLWSDFQHTELLNFLDQQFFDYCIADHGFPIQLTSVDTFAVLLQLVMFIDTRVCVGAPHDYVDNLLCFESLLHGKDCLKHIHHLFLGLNAGLGVQAVVAVATVVLAVFLAEIAQNIHASAHGTFCIRHNFLDQLASHLLFGDVLVGEELVQSLNVVFGIESDAFAFAAVASGTSCFLIVAFKAFGYVVMYHETHIGFVNTHTEGYGSHYYIDLLHEELVLVFGTGFCIESCMIWQRFDAVDHQQFGQILDTFSCEAIDNSALVRILFYESYYLFVQHKRFGRFRPHLVVQVGPVKAGNEYLGILHLQILDDVLLHFGCGRSREGKYRYVVVDHIDGTAQAAVFGAEVMPPFRDTVCFINGEKAYFQLFQKIDGFFLGKSLWSHIQKFSSPLQEVLFHFSSLLFVE